MAFYYLEIVFLVVLNPFINISIASTSSFYVSKFRFPCVFCVIQANIGVLLYPNHKVFSSIDLINMDHFFSFFTMHRYLPRMDKKINYIISFKCFFVRSPCGFIYRWMSIALGINHFKINPWTIILFSHSRNSGIIFAINDVPIIMLPTYWYCNISAVSLNMEPFVKSALPNEFQKSSNYVE